MARKIVNRKELRAEAEAAEAQGLVEKKEPKEPKVKKATKRKSRSKVATPVRLKAFWGVFNQSLKRVATFEYDERKKAEKKAEDLSGEGKSPHFIQLVKEVIED